MKRSRYTVHKILRIWAFKHQQEVAAAINADQSTVSRIENGEVLATPDLEWRFVSACGGLNSVRSLIDHLQNFLDRLTLNRLPLMPA